METAIPIIPLLASQRLYGVNLGGADSGIEAGEQADGETDAYGDSCPFQRQRAGDKTGKITESIIQC
jgi:hypothetical protein